MASDSRWIESARAMFSPLLRRFQGGSGRSRLARAASWNILGGFLSRFATLAGSFWIAHRLGKDGLGRLGIILNTCMTLSVFASFGLGMTATRFISMCRLSDPDRAGRIAILVTWVTTLLSITVAAVVFTLSNPIAAGLLGSPELGFYLRLASPLLVLGALQETVQGVLAGLEAFPSVAKTSASTGALQAIGMVAGAHWGGLAGCLGGAAAGSLVGITIAATTLRSEILRHGLAPRPGGWGGEWSRIWGFALPAVLVGGIVMLANWISSVMLVRLPDGESQMGLFTAANQWRNAILYVPSLVASAGLPVLTQLWADKGGAHYIRTIQFKFLIGLVSSVAISLPIIVASPLIFRGYGPGFSEGPLVLVFLAGSAVLASSANMLGQAIVGEGRMWTGFAVNLVWAATLIGLAHLWMRTDGALGLAQAQLASFSVYLALLGLPFLASVRRQSVRQEP